MPRARYSTRIKTGRKGKVPPKDRVTLPPMPGDLGATGPANLRGLVVEDRPVIDEDGKQHNPNGRKGARRLDHIAEWHRRGQLSAAAVTIANDLRDAFEATQMGPVIDYTAERVDSSPKPDHAVTIQVARLSRYRLIARHIPFEDRQVISQCVLHWPTCHPLPGCPPGLAAALDRLAERIRKEHS